MENITLNVKTMRRIFLLLEEINDLFHQPAKYSDLDEVKKFADKNYNEIKELYYHEVWNTLHKKEQNKVMHD